MEKIKNYSLGILFCCLILGAIMLYVMPLGRYFFGENPTVIFIFSRAAIWFCLILMLLYSKIIEKGTFLLWKEQQKTFKFYLVAIPALYLTCIFGNAIINIIINQISPEKISDKLLGLTPMFKNNTPLILLTCLTAAVTEELLMRGYMQPRLCFIYKNKWVGIFATSLIFGLLHISYGTIMQVVGTFFIGLVFSVFYEKYRNIKALIICHFLIDFISLMAITHIDAKTLTSLL